MKTAVASDVATRGLEVASRYWWLEMRSYYCFNFYFKYVWLHKNMLYVNVCTALQSVHLLVCPCVSSASIDSGQRHLKKKKSHHRPLLSHQFKGLFSTKKKALGEEKRWPEKKKTDFKMCSKEKQSQGSLLFSLLFAFFLCSYRKEQNDCGVQLQVKGVETGYWIDLNTFTDFHGGHLTFEKGGWGLR